MPARRSAVSAGGGTKAIVAALLANLGIAVTKFIAFLLTGSSSMLAESIHSVADSGNQALLLLGGKRATARGHPAAPVRVRPRALHLRVHRLDRAVQRRRPVRALRGVPQVARAADTGRHRRAGSGCRSSCCSSRSSWSRSRFRTAIMESNHVRGKASWVQLRPPGQGARAAGRAAGGPRRAARPGLRALRRRDDPDHRQRLLGRRRHRDDRRAAGGHRGHARDRDQEPAARRGRDARGRRRRSSRRSPTARRSSGSST